jgi:hypothetical protein
LQELEPAVGEQLVNVWNQSSAAARPMSTPGGLNQMSTAGYNPAPFLATDYHSGQRLQYSMQHLQQSGSWTTAQQRPSYSPWNAGPSPRPQAHLGGAHPPVDYGMQHYAYAVQQAAQIPSVVHSTTASQFQTAGGGSSSTVSILQRSTGSESGSGSLGSL